MKTFSEHIKHIQGKPHHVRKRIAFGTATFGAALIAFVWFIGSLSSGVFAIKDTSFAASAGTVVGGGAENNTAGSGVAGVGAASALPQSASAPAHIEIIDAASSTRSNKQAERTTIPF